MISILCHSRENEARSRKLIVYLASAIRNTRYIDDLFRKKERGKTTLGRDKNMNYLNFAKTHHIIVEACFPNLISLLKHTHSGELLQMPEIRFSLCVSCLTSYVANYRICNDIGMLFHDNNLEKIWLRNFLILFVFISFVLIFPHSVHINDLASRILTPNVEDVRNRLAPNKDVLHFCFLFWGASHANDKNLTE